MTYDNAVAWAVDNVPMEQFDSFDEWYNAVKEELQTPALFEVTTVNNKLRDEWDKQREEPEPEGVLKTEQIKEPTAKEVEHELERNLAPEQRSSDFITQEKTGALSNVLSSLPKGTKISIPQPKGAPIELKPSVTVPSGITMVRPPTLPTVTVTPFARVVGAVRVGVSTVSKAVRTGIKVIFRI